MLSVNDICALIPELLEPPIKNIRFRKETNQVAIIDVIRIITCKPSRQAGEQLKYVLHRNQKVVEKIDHFQFKGQGQRLTPICDAETMTIIVMHLPGKWAAELRTQFAKIVCSAMAGDVIQRYGVLPAEARFWHGESAVGASPELLEFQEARNSSKASHKEKMDTMKNNTSFKASRADYKIATASTSHAVLGMYPKEFKETINVKDTASARDFMTLEQQVNVNLIDTHMFEWARDHPGCTRDEWRTHQAAASKSMFDTMQMMGHHVKHGKYLTAEEGKTRKRKMALITKVVKKLKLFEDAEKENLALTAAPAIATPIITMNQPTIFTFFAT